MQLTGNTLTVIHPATAAKHGMLAILLIVELSITGCASTPDFNLDAVDQTINPRDVAADPERYQSKKVLWGGVIIDGTNVKQGTELEVLVYPLDSNLKPAMGKSTMGRIIAFNQGYLETLDYAPGRLLTLVGSVQNVEKRPVDKAMYDYPVVKIAQLHLWPRQDTEGDSRVRFGVGVGIVVH